MYWELLVRLVAAVFITDMLHELARVRNTLLSTEYNWFHCNYGKEDNEWELILESESDQTLIC